MHDAISDLPARVSIDDSAIAYPRKGRQKHSTFQRHMRLDCSTHLLKSAAKRDGKSPDQLYNHHTKGIERRRRKIIAAIGPGETGDSLPQRIWNGTRGHKWRRLDPQQPSYTILAQMHRDLSEWIHPKHNRWITVREAARLQSFHDGFIFHGSECQQLKQVGNAVPPLMALAVARAAKNLLKSIHSEARRRR